MNNNPIVATFALHHSLSEQTQLDFNAIISLQSFKKKTFLLETGKVATTLFYIKKGLARAFYNQDGEEITFYFAIDNQFIGAV
ncbi:MAG: hypothetical protein ABI207_07760, partial [Crocinitomicaceae bacterium]